MELDEMKTKWAEQDVRIDRSLRLNRALLSEIRLNQTQIALRRDAWFSGLHAALWLVCLLALGRFAYREIADARFSIPAVLVGIYCIGMLQSLVRQMAMAGGMDYSQPVAAIQRKVGRLRILRIRTTQWGVLVGIAVWAPAAIVVLEALTGFHAFSGIWVVANVALGLALIPLAVWAAKKYGEGMDRSPLMQHILRSLAGNNLTAATAFLGTLTQFEEE